MLARAAALPCLDGGHGRCAIRDNKYQTSHIFVFVSQVAHEIGSGGPVPVLTAAVMRLSSASVTVNALRLRKA